MLKGIKKILFTIFLLFVPNSVFAACLEGHPTVSDEFKKSEYVVIGKVISVESVPESKDYYEGYNYTVYVQQSLRGNLEGKVTIFSENSSGRFPMNVGDIYILFIHKELGLLQVDNCGNSGLLPESTNVVQEVNELIK